MGNNHRVLWDNDVLGGGLDVEGLEGVANGPGVEDLAIDVGGEKPGHVADVARPYANQHERKLITENLKKKARTKIASLFREENESED